MTIYAGLDVSDKTTHVCLVDGAGAVVRRDVVASDPDVLARWLRRHAAGLARAVLETGPLSTFLHEFRGHNTNSGDTTTRIQGTRIQGTQYSNSGDTILIRP